MMRCPRAEAGSVAGSPTITAPAILKSLETMRLPVTYRNPAKSRILPGRLVDPSIAVVQLDVPTNCEQGQLALGGEGGQCAYSSGAVGGTRRFATGDPVA